MYSAFGGHEGRTALIGGVVNLVHFTLVAGTVDEVVAKSTDTLLILS